MENLMIVTLVECALWLAQQGERPSIRPDQPPLATGSAVLFGKPLRGDSPDFPFSVTAPADPIPFTRTFHESFDVFSHQRVARFAVAVPWRVNAGTLTFSAQGQGVEAPPGASGYAAFDPFTTVDQGTAHASIQWRDQREDELQASVGRRYDLVQASQGVEDAAISLKAMLPAPFLAWYVQGSARADSERSEQVALSLGALRDMGGGSQVRSSVAVTRREYARRSRQKMRNNVLNWAIRWDWNIYLGLSISVNYYLDVHDIEALMSFEVKPAPPSSMGFFGPWGH
jgi:hypothetical protein